MEAKLHDLIIVGGGPAGLSAAINGASEGLSVVLIDAQESMGGQARESAAIENYPMPLGDEQGVTGLKLMEGFISQAAKFACSMETGCPVVGIDGDVGRRRVLCQDGREFLGRSVILSQGLHYRRHEAKGIDPLLNRGVYYGMPSTWSLFTDCTVVVVGGANSAGQAIVRMMARPGVRIKVLCRKPLEETMSKYLLDRIKASPGFGTHDATVKPLVGAELTEVMGDGQLDRIAFEVDGRRTELDCSMVIFYIGAVPNTEWLRGVVELDELGFVPTGHRCGVEGDPNQFMTRLPGVFCVGDVRCGSTKRIVNAVGEGGAALQEVHEFLKGLDG